MRKHRCGGMLSPRQVLVFTDEHVTSAAVVRGLVCDRCHEELIDYKTARDLANDSSAFTSLEYPGTASTPRVEIPLSSNQGVRVLIK
jgi:hypothetical protein